MNQGDIVSGMVVGKVRTVSQIVVMTHGVRAFLPGSLVDIRGPIKDTSPYEGKGTRSSRSSKLDKKRNNVVVSRRAVLEVSMGAEREAAVDAGRKRHRQRYRQEHHRLRRVRGPRWHRWPAAHHR